MFSFKSLISRWRQIFESQQIRLSRHDARLQLAILGLLTGIASGLVITAFRGGIELLQGQILPGGDIENYEALALPLRFLLPVAGGLLIGLLFHYLSRESTVVGVVHVMERLSYHQGRLPFKAAAMQFLGGIIAIVTGHSVGREGPAVHLGAASGSLIAQQLHLPNNTIRTLAGCGVAAAISASFNTPLAGVIFALEVIMLEYTLASFLPIILAAVSADAISIYFFGNESLIQVQDFSLNSLGELGIVFILGIFIGGASGCFNWLLKHTAIQVQDIDFRIRALLAGALVGVCAIPFPEVMGIGYDTLHLTLLGELSIGLLFGITAFKLIATAGTIGLGIPGGLIGPTLLMGATLGGAIGGMAQLLMPESTAGPHFYALMGIAAMMGATLQAPLAALTAVLELTTHPGVILPGMLVIVTASLISSELLKQDSIFITLLKARGLDFRNDPVTQLLRREGVASSMDREFIQLHQILERSEAESSLVTNPNWLIIRADDGEPVLMPAIDLARHLQENEDEEIDLMQIPASRLQLAAVDLRATLQEANNILNSESAEALFVQRMTAPAIYKTYGILTREKIEAAYKI